jgi:hypothetical protein
MMKKLWSTSDVLRNQFKPEEGGSHRAITTTSDPKRNLEAGRNDGSTQLIYIQVGQTWYAFLQATTKSRWIPAGLPSSGFYRTQAISQIPANAGATKAR